MIAVIVLTYIHMMLEDGSGDQSRLQVCEPSKNNRMYGNSYVNLCSHLITKDAAIHIENLMSHMFVDELIRYSVSPE